MASSSRKKGSNSLVFRGLKKDEHKTKTKTGVINASILEGDFAPIEIPAIEIPGSKPLVFEDSNQLLEQVYGADQFDTDDNEEEFLMFTVELYDRKLKRQDGPHQTLRWRRKVRQEYKSSREVALEKVNEDKEGEIEEAKPPEAAQIQDIT